MTYREHIAAIAARCQADDEDALIALIDATTRYLVRSVGLDLYRHEVDAEGVLQETYWRYWKRRADVIPDLTLPWLICVAKRVKVDKLRQRYTEDRKVAKLRRTHGMAPKTQPEWVVESDHDILQYVRSMPSYQRRIVCLRAEGYTLEEIGRAVGANKVAVFRQLARARNGLKQHCG